MTVFAPGFHKSDKPTYKPEFHKRIAQATYCNVLPKQRLDVIIKMTVQGIKPYHHIVERYCLGQYLLIRRKGDIRCSTLNDYGLDDKSSYQQNDCAEGSPGSGEHLFQLCLDLAVGERQGSSREGGWSPKQGVVRSTILLAAAAAEDISVCYHVRVAA